MKSCYVHIPFCDSICYYCDFCRVHSNGEIRKKWLNQITLEIKEKKLDHLDTLYFGGGTPSSLNLDEFKKLATLFQPAKEWTVECNPDSLDEEKIKLYKEFGVNRISLGVQSFNDDLLKTINRKHTSNDVFRVISLLKKVGFDNISIDLIYGLPHQTLADVQRDIDSFLSLNLTHLSIYSLQIEENSVFGKQKIKPCDPELEADMYELICKKLDDAGYEHYEISSFCQKGWHSRHNLAYWQDKDFLGIGMGASGREKGIRYDNTRVLQTYLNEGPSPIYIEESHEERSFDAIMMALRTTFGLDINEWNERYQMDFLKKYQPVLDKYKELLILKDSRLVPTLQAMEILNTILVDFLMID